MVTSTSFALMMAICWSGRRVHQQLILLNIFEIYILINATFHLVLVRLSVLEKWGLWDVKLPILVEEVLGGPWLSVLTARYQERDVIVFDVVEERKYSLECLRTLLFLNEILWLDEMPLLVANIARSWSTGILGVDTSPSLFENILNLL